MNKIDRQILKNQVSIMKHFISYGSEISLKLKNKIEETEELLNPKESNTESKIKKSMEEN